MGNDKKNILKSIKTRSQFLLVLFMMIRERKKWWLLPLLFLLAVLSLFVNVLKDGAILPAIYTFF